MKIYLVGGAVRDMVLGKEPKDRDYVIVGATPDDVKRMVDEGYMETGKDFPVFRHPETGDEYAFARVERKTGVGYHGFEFDTSGVTLEMDLSRRDLTINSMAMDLETGEIIDPYGGKEDLKACIIRHTTVAFAEDPLRVFRAARFAARYGFVVHPDTIALMQQLVDDGEIQHLSKERIVSEMMQIVVSAQPGNAFAVLHQIGALKMFSERFVDIQQATPEAIVLLMMVEGISAEDKMGALMGFCAASSQPIPEDKNFMKELHNIGLPLRTIKTAIAFKNFGLMDEATCASEKRVLEMIRRLEFHQGTEWNAMYKNVCTQCTSMIMPQRKTMLMEMFERFDEYVKEMAKIDRQAIADRLKGKGRLIGEWITLEEIDAIKVVDKRSQPKSFTIVRPS